MTPAGKKMLPHAKKILTDVAEMNSFFRTEKILGGTIRIGMVQSLFELLPDNTYINFHQKYPLSTMELTIDGTSNLKELMQSGQLDVACLIDDPMLPNEWNVWDSIEVPIVVVANPAHRLACKDTVRIEDLKNQELIMMEDSAPYSKHFYGLLEEYKIKTANFLKLQSADTARRLAERENYLAVIPLYTVHNAACSGRIKILNIKEVKLTQSVQLIVQRSKIITPQIEGVLEEISHALGNSLSEIFH